MRASLAALAAVAGCVHATTPVRRARAGVAIAIYEHAGATAAQTGYAIVDDRREVEVSGDELVLANVDPGAELASLEIVSISGELALGACARDRVPIAPNPPVAEVRCHVSAGTGRHLVRLLYTSKAITYHAEHWINLDSDRAVIASRYAIATPSWQGERADVSLFDSASSDSPPRLVAHGAVTLDGSTAVIAGAPLTVTASLHRVYMGAQVDAPASPTSTQHNWGGTATNDVWVVLDLASAQLAPGEAYVHVAGGGEAEREVVVAHDRRHVIANGVRLDLWIDDTLHASRERTNDGATDLALLDHLMYTVANTGETAREISIEEPLRVVPLSAIEHAWPRKPERAGDIVRETLSIEPHALERIGFTLHYRE